MKDIGPAAFETCPAFLACVMPLPTGARALIAARMVIESEARQKEEQAKKAAWIRSARSSFETGEKQPCCICSKYKRFAQAHHSYPLHAQYDRGVRKAIHEYDWLCPTHHAAIHFVIDSLLGNRGYSALFEMPADEAEAVDLLASKFVKLWSIRP